jgi:hypothetical protein
MQLDPLLVQQAGRIRVGAVAADIPLMVAQAELELSSFVTHTEHQVRQLLPRSLELQTS